MRLRLVLVVLAVLAALVPAARADETTFCNAYITTLPYTINTQGHYCFNRNLSTAITTGAAITINVDYVVLDLNNFKLGGGSAGPTSLATGIRSTDHSNLTIRNGNIRGFFTGIEIESNTGAPANVVIENNVIDGNIYGGIFSVSDNVTVRNNQVINTGLGGVGTYAFGVVAYGFPAVIEDNLISGLYAEYATAAFNYYGVFQNNTVTTAPAFAGVHYPGVCRDNNLLYRTLYLDCFTSSGTLYGWNPY